jgi:hypothetical protein
MIHNRSCPAFAIERKLAFWLAAAFMQATTLAAPSSNPRVDVTGANGPINAIVVADDTVYLGGQFTRINGADRTNIAALDVVTGMASEWNPGASGAVRALAYSQGKIYAGGDFSAIGGKPRGRLAELSADSSGATDWNPAIAGGGTQPFIGAIVTLKDRVIIAGAFGQAAGEARSNIAAFDLKDGRLLGWNPLVPAPVSALSANERYVYVGTSDPRISGATPAIVLAIETTNSSAGFQLELGKYLPGPFSGAPPIYTKPSMIRGLTLSEDSLFLLTYTYNGRAPPAGFNHLLAMRLSTHLQRWETEIQSTSNNPIVNSVAVSGGVVYVGGTDLLQSFPLPFAVLNVSSYSAETGQRLTWNPQSHPSASVQAITATENSVFVGGEFPSVNNLALTNFAMFSPVGFSRLTMATTGTGSLAVRLQGNATETYQIQSSTNLQNWQTVITLTLSNAPALSPVPPSSAPQFFRAVH